MNSGSRCKLPLLVRRHVLEPCLSKATFSSCAIRLGGHDNPLGLPRAGIPSNLAARMKRGLPERRPISNVKKIIAVSSAKGGVGKSTIAVNLALALSRLGHHTGILDADIYGPSIPTLLNLHDIEPTLDEPTATLQPLVSHGLPTMSIGYLIPSTSPLAWRGPMLQKALQQLLFSVLWPHNLSYLILDMPPGTGDVALTVAQSVVVDGAIVVSTPSALSVADARRGLEFWRKAAGETKLLGVVRNMGRFVCGECGKVHEVFGKDGVARMCEEVGGGVKVVADVPLDGSVGNATRPTMVEDPEGAVGRVFTELAERVVRGLEA